MTTLLAIETSGGVCSVAVSVNGALRSSTEILVANVHDEALLRCVRETMFNADVSIGDLDVVAVSAGPGSFTGLRIGVSFAKGLCYDNNPKLLAVPTLTSLMHASTEVARLAGYSSILAVIASHRDLYYVSTSPTNHPTHVSEVVLLSREEVLSHVHSSTLVVGPAAELFSPLPISGLTRLSARFVAYAAWRLLATNVPFADPKTFVPDYQQEFVVQSGTSSSEG